MITNIKILNITIKFKLLVAIITLLVIISIVTGSKYYNKLFKQNVNITTSKGVFIFIPTNSTFSDVLNILNEKDIIINQESFEWVSEKKQYINSVKPGKYLISKGMSNNSLINMLRSGIQSPLTITFNNFRTKSRFTSKISENFEFDSLQLATYLDSAEYVEKFGFTTDNILTMFIPNTYEMLWNYSPETFIKKMHKYYENFWNEERREKAKQINLSPIKVSILSSIVQQETNKTSEMRRIAGVYINRINKSMLLQADPTVKFALGNFTLKRILYRHLEYDSPYNTYIYNGVPPGPICMPDITTIDHVLNFEKHSYMFFCAKEDFSGYHNFAKTSSQHEQNAAKYHRALSKRNY